MRKCRFIGLCLLCLAYAFSPLPAQEQPASIPSTLEGRKVALSELMFQKSQLPADDTVARVQMTNRIVELNLKLRDLDAALAGAAEALQLSQQFGFANNGQLLVDTLALAALVHIRRQEIDPALTLLHRALKLSRLLSYRRGEALTHQHFATAYFHLNKLLPAEETVSRALSIWRELQDKHGEAEALTTQGEIYIVQDRPDQAISSLKLAEEIWQNLAEPAEHARTLLDENFVAVRQGQWQTSLALINKADSIVNDKQAEPYVAGQIATSLGEVHEAYAQLPIALAYFKESLAHYDGGAHDISATVDARNKVGRVLARLGNFEEARGMIEQGLPLAQKTGNDLLIGLSHEDLGRVWLASGSYEQARVEFQTAVSYFKKSGSQRPWARAQSYLGQIDYLLGDTANARAAYETALEIFQKLPDYTNEAAVCFRLGQLALQQHQLEEAGKYLRRSIELTEQLRENASSKDLRSSFLDSIHDRYQAYVEYLMALHARQPNERIDIKAFEASEFGRARALLDSLAPYQRELQGLDPGLLLQEEKLQKEEQRLIDKRAKFISLTNSEKERVEIDSQLTNIRSRYETLQARINSAGKSLDFLRPRPFSYERLSEVTDAETSLIEYSLGTDRSFVWVLTQDGLISKELADKRTIEMAVTKVLDLLSYPTNSPDHLKQLDQAIEEVSKLVLVPISSHLHGSRLLVVADGILQYVPFQILSAAGQAQNPLIDRFDIVNTPSASTLSVLRQQGRNRQQSTALLVGFGDPIFASGEREDGSGRTAESRSNAVINPFNLPRLFYSKRELRTIQDLTGPGSEFYVEHAATRHNLLNVDLSRFRILHLVTHGVLNGGQPELSGLLLSMVDANNQPLDGFVGLADIYKLRAPVDLVVLSACHSALGKDFRGEGLIGLTRGFMHAGASSVVASLWNVNDEAGAELMKHFYANMLQQGMTPSSALRAAQMKIREQPQWRSPYYWAAFTLQGDYRQVIKPQPAPGRFTLGLQILAGVMFLIVVAGLVWWCRRRRWTATFS